MRRLWLSLALLGLLSGCGGAPGEVSPVYTDWSQLEPYQPPEAVYTEFTPYSGESLQPREDYGPLLPYVGSYPDSDSYMGPLPLLGLVTAGGAIVTDPVYAQIQMAGDFWGSVPDYGPFLLLYRGELSGHETTEWGTYPVGNFSLTVAAPDGSWVRELGTRYGYPLALPGDRLAVDRLDGSVLILAADGRETRIQDPDTGYGSPSSLRDGRLSLLGDDGSVLVLDAANTVSRVFPASALEPYLGQGFQWGEEGVPSLSWDRSIGQVWSDSENDPDGDGVACWLNADTGAVTAERPADYVPTEHTDAEAPAIPGYDGYITTLADPITGAAYYYARRGDDSGRDLLDGSGNVVLADCEMPYLTLGTGDGFSPWVWGDRIAYGEDGFFCYCDLEGNLMFRYPVETNSD